MKRYEYKVEIIKIGIFFDSNTKQEKQLNTAGSEGWQLVAIVAGKKYLKYCYMREL